MKGAPEFLFPCCTRYINKNGSVSKIDSEFTNLFNAVVLDFTHKSLRIVLLAYKEVTEVPEHWDEIEQGLIFIGLMGIEDPLKIGIK